MPVDMGYEIQLGMGASAPATELYQYISGDITLTEEIRNPGGMHGFRGEQAERSRQGTRRTGGTLNLQPNAVEMANLLPRWLGAAAVGTLYDLGLTLSAFVVTMDKGSKVFTYSNCYGSVLSFQASQGQILNLAASIEGGDVSVGAAGSFPALTLNTSGKGPFIMEDCILSVGGTAYPFRELEITIDNMVDGEQFYNNLTRQRVTARDRRVTCRLSAPYGDASALYGVSITGVQVIATFTHTDVATPLTITMPKVQFPRITPTANGREEIMIPLEGVARRDGGTQELNIVLDSTP